jgi:hypothetical protein
MWNFVEHDWAHGVGSFTLFLDGEVDVDWIDPMPWHNRPSSLP